METDNLNSILNKAIDTPSWLEAQRKLSDLEKERRRLGEDYCTGFVGSLQYVYTNGEWRMFNPVVADSVFFSTEPSTVVTQKVASSLSKKIDQDFIDAIRHSSIYNNVVKVQTHQPILTKDTVV
jgi:hypothetical protein